MTTQAAVSPIRTASTTTKVLPCEEPDGAWRAAVEAGASAVEEPSRFLTGDRYRVIMDPFGHLWAIMTRAEDVSVEESLRRIAECPASLAG